MDPKEEDFWRDYFGDVKDMEQRHRDQMDAVEYAMRQAAGIKKNLFDDMIGEPAHRSAAEAKATEAEAKKKFREAFHKRQYGKNWHGSYIPYVDEDDCDVNSFKWPETPDVLFLEVFCNSRDDEGQLSRLMSIIGLKKRPEVRLEPVWMIGRNGFRLTKRRPKKNPNEVVVRVLTKDEVTVKTADPIAR